MPTELGLLGGLSREVHEHLIGELSALLCLALLLVLPRIFPSHDRVHHHRFSAACLIVYLSTIPVHGALAALHLEGSHNYIDLPASLLLSFGIIGVTALILFDVLGRSVIRLRILRDITSVAAAIVVLFSLLHKNHVNLAGLVATSAVLGGVLGFALQETLGNIISGIALQLESTMSPGDWVTIGDVSGQVTEIRWRSTAITTRNDDLVVIPNGLLAKGQIINLSRPVPWHRQWVQFDVHYRHPPNEVQRVVLQAVKGLPNVKQDDPPPDCIFYRAEQDHAHYALRYRLLDLRRDDATDSEVKKRLWYAFRRHGIEIPYPARNLFLTELSKERETTEREREQAARIAALKKVDLFAPLDDGHIDSLARGLRVEAFGDAETILEQGSDGDSLYLLRRGSVSVHVTVDGIEREVAVVKAGELFGEMSLLTGDARRATVSAKEDVECYVIDRMLFQEVIGDRIAPIHEISEIFAARTAELEGELNELGAEAARLRDLRKRDLVSRIKAFFGVGPASADGTP